MSRKDAAQAVTINACKLCNPLGASLVFRGIEGAIPLLHGSQGCATYIRRYIISHFKEPIDIASSNFSESSTIFGGGLNLTKALKNVISQYQPDLVGIATTCLSETIGDNVNLILHSFSKEELPGKRPEIVWASTPSYQGSHIDGFHTAVYAVIKQLAAGGPGLNMVSLFPGMVSAADLRYLKEVVQDFDLEPMMLPDYSETMDGPTWESYQKFAPGGTPIAAIKAAGRSRAAIQLGRAVPWNQNAAALLGERFQIPASQLGLPVGIKETDEFLDILSVISGRPVPQKYRQERGRLVDAYIDGHKYLFGKKGVVFGEPDLVVGLASFLSEIGVIPVLCATGTESGNLEAPLRQLLPAYRDQLQVAEGVDFNDLAEQVEALKPDLLIGNSKGYSIARQLKLPLIRTGFPVHDRVGGQRLLHLGYRGAQRLFDEIVNEIIRERQDASPVGYSYI